MGSKKKPPYDAEFREGAVRIVVETGKPVGEVAEELGINPGTLHSWVSRWRRNGTTSSDRPAQPAAASAGGGRMRGAERSELERLRREVGEKNKRIRELELEMELPNLVVKPPRQRVVQAGSTLRHGSSPTGR